MMRKSILLRGMCRRVLKCADVTLAVSKPLQRRLSNCGIKDAVYLPNSVDTESIPKVEGSANKERILFVGNLTENKRPLVLIKAFEDVIKLVPGATLIMCGDGPLRTMVQEEVEKSGLSGKVRTLLNVRPEVLNTLRSRTGIFVLPSIAEGLSMALLESMAAGQAVIASRNESHLSILEHGKNCLLFDPDDSDQLAAEIVLVMSDDRLRLEIGQAAKQLCEAQFSNRVVAQELENIYLRTISRWG
jgi:glycosyltransferase involved in cell wall biosynthesis